jgi:hypothetical protein
MHMYMHTWLACSAEAERWLCMSLCIAGPLPAAWRNLDNLHTLHLNDNHLQGDIPLSWGQLESMQELQLSNNAKLVGSFPSKQLAAVATYSGTGLREGGLF